MTTYNWSTDPTDKSFSVQTLELGYRSLSSESVSPMSGDVQTASLPGNRIVWAVGMPRQTWNERRKLQAFLLSLNGRENRVAFYDIMRPLPLGTIPTSGVTLSAAMAQFATSAAFATGVPGCTIKAGDWFKIGTQVFMCTQDTTANGSGVMASVPFRFMARTSASSGTGVYLYQPTALFVLDAAEINMGRNIGASNAEAFSFNLVEVFS